MRISISITDFSWPTAQHGLAAQLAEVARAADDGGLDTVWVADHLIQADPHSDPDSPMLEAYTTLGYLAGQTRRIRLGTMVTAVTFRPPAVLVKAVTTMDVLSGGRAWLGLGAGYHQDEARAMGLPLPPTRERFEQLEETVRLALRMWEGDASPPPLSRPRPPILIGGMGERRTLRLVARYADACNLFDIPDGGETVRRKLDVLARHCDELGRDVGTIETTLSSRLAPGETAEQFAERCAGLAERGFDHVVLVTAGAWTLEDIELVSRAAALVD